MYAQLPNGIKVFYREAGSSHKSTILLLHGFPASSFQFRKLIPILASKYHVVAPDLPGFGFTSVPSELSYQYRFSSIADTIESFIDVLSIKKFAIYIFDYGGPTGLRIALKRPSAITAIIAQNGNAYEEGLQSWWDPVRDYWKQSGDAEQKTRELLRDNVLTFEAIKGQYVLGTPGGEESPRLDPVSWSIDHALMSRPGNKDIQLDLFKDYGTNVPLYPQYQEYFRKSQVPLLAVWGANDIIFPPVAAEAYKKDLPNARIELLDAGHFAGETHAEEIGEKILEFLGENGI